MLDELDWIKRAVTNTNDVALIFLSGHGITTPDQQYRFLPYDYDPDRIERTTISRLGASGLPDKDWGEENILF